MKKEPKAPTSIFHTPESLLKYYLDRGDSRALPVTTRHRDDLTALVYEKGEILVRAYSWPFPDGETKPEKSERKERTRQMIRDWLERNDIDRDSVKVLGREEKGDYGARFHAWAEVLKPITLYVPGPNDPWWEEHKTRPTGGPTT